MKRLMAAALSAALCVTAAAAAPAWAVNTDLSQAVLSENKVGESGVCGTNAKWDLSGGTLTITGSGDMAAWAMNTDTPWYQYRDSIRNVVIAEGITNIGPSAFAECKNLSSVSIPSTVTSIKRGAFMRCASLSSIVLPSSVASLGRDALRECASLRSVTIYNPECNIVGGNLTVCNSENSGQGSYSGTIFGYSGSTAETYAKKYKANFSVVGSEPVTPTTTTTTPTTTTTTSTSTTTSSTSTTSTSTSTTTSSTSTTTTTTTAPVITTTTQGIRTSFFFRDSTVEVGNYAEYYTDGWPLDHFEVSDTSIAVIENGNKIKGIAPGTVDVTFYTSPASYNTCQLTVFLRGDVNDNNTIDAVDASRVLAEYARTSTSGEKTFSSSQALAADVDKNGSIDAVDASKILAYYAYTGSTEGALMTLSEFIISRL